MELASENLLSQKFAVGFKIQNLVDMLHAFLKISGFLKTDFRRRIECKI